MTYMLYSSDTDQILFLKTCTCLRKLVIFPHFDFWMTKWDRSGTSSSGRKISWQNITFARRGLYHNTFYFVISRILRIDDRDSRTYQLYFSYIWDRSILVQLEYCITYDNLWCHTRDKCVCYGCSIGCLWIPLCENPDCLKQMQVLRNKI